MSLLRSPTQTSEGRSRTGSEPDLSRQDSESLGVTLRKRKRTELDNQFKTEFAEFRKEIMNFLTDFSASQKEDFRIMKEDISQIKKQATAMNTTVEKLVHENCEMKKDISDLKESLNFHSAEQGALKSRLDSTVTTIGKFKSLEQNFYKLEQEHHHLQSEHNLLQQRERLLNLEIAGIMEKAGENARSYMIGIAKCANINLTDDDIVAAHRVQPKVQVPGRPKNIIVQLKSLTLKDSIISAIRRRKGITSIEIGIQGESRNIYVNEHLIPALKILLKQTRDTAKSAGYKSVWVRNCKIFARKDDTSPKIHIRGIEDLKKLK